MLPFLPNTPSFTLHALIIRVKEVNPSQTIRRLMFFQKSLFKKAVLPETEG